MLSCEEGDPAVFGRRGEDLLRPRISGEIGHCNCNSAGNCLNVSMCAYTTGVDSVTVIAWNPLGQNTSSWLRIPVTGASYTVTDLASKATVPSQAIAIDDRTKQLPLLCKHRRRLPLRRLPLRLLFRLA